MGIKTSRMILLIENNHRKNNHRKSQKIHCVIVESRQEKGVMNVD
jgi:hypothetical protein